MTDELISVHPCSRRHLRTHSDGNIVPHEGKHPLKSSFDCGAPRKVPSPPACQRALSLGHPLLQATTVPKGSLWLCHPGILAAAIPWDTGAAASLPGIAARRVLGTAIPMAGKVNTQGVKSCRIQ